MLVVWRSKNRSEAFSPLSFIFVSALTCFAQRMPQEPRVVSDVRSMLDKMRETLEKMMLEENFFDFMSSQGLTQLTQKRNVELLRKVTNILHIQHEVSHS